MQHAKNVRVELVNGSQCLAMAIFAMLLIATSTTAGAQTFSTLVDFDNTNGAGPDAGLVQGRNGNLYGTASSGGANGDGTVFKMTSKGTMTVLHDFDYTDGDYPEGALLLSNNGNFYGTTNGGGTNPYNTYGTIFKMSATGKLKSMFSFDLTDGASPTAALIQGIDGDYYGTTYGDGSGTVFKMTADGALTSLYGFPTEFVAPFAGLVLGNDDNFMVQVTSEEAIVTEKFSRSHPRERSQYCTPSTRRMAGGPLVLLL
jgi:uncharacterized repeat protein (TIGR03803 family)